MLKGKGTFNFKIWCPESLKVNNYKIAKLRFKQINKETITSGKSEKPLFDLNFNNELD